MDEKILENVNDSLDDAFERGRRLVNDEEFGKRLEELTVRARDTIRKHPVKSIAVGVLAGYVLGKLFSPEE